MLFVFISFVKVTVNRVKMVLAVISSRAVSDTEQLSTPLQKMGGTNETSIARYDGVIV